MYYVYYLYVQSFGVFVYVYVHVQCCGIFVYALYILSTRAVLLYASEENLILSVVTFSVIRE